MLVVCLEEYFVQKKLVISSRDQTPEAYKVPAMSLNVARSLPQRLIDTIVDDEPEFFSNLSLNKSVVSVIKQTRHSSKVSRREGTLEGAYLALIVLY
jgi:hypothetical protein